MFSIITVPFGWILKVVYNLVNNYGIAIIIFTFLSKLVILPFQMKSKKSMLDMQRLQPRLAELEKKYKDNKEKYALETQKLYKEEGVSLFGGCLPMLIMLPIMFGLYYVVREPLVHIFELSSEQLMAIAEFLRAQGVSGIPETIVKTDYMLQIEVAKHVSNPAFSAEILKIAPSLANVDFTFLGIDLTQIPKFGLINWLWAIPILSGLTAWLSGWLMRAQQGANVSEQTKTTNSMMNFMMPAMSVWIAFMVPAGLGLYWIVSNILSAAQEPLLTLYFKNKAKKKASEGK